MTGIAAAPLQVFACPTCGGPLPLPPGDTLRCPYCHTPVAVPADYRALRDGAVVRGQALDLLQRLGRPPGLPQRLAAWITGPLPGIFIGVPLCLWLGNQIAHVVLALVRWLAPAGDHAPTGSLETVLGFGVMVGCAALVLIWAAFGAGGVVERRRLQAALAAGAPVAPGGPASCRRCGAPLAMQPGASAARCAYCRADNLLDLPEAWTGRALGEVQSLRREVGDVVQAWELSRARVRRALLWRAGVSVLLFSPLVAYVVAYLMYA